MCGMAIARGRGIVRSKKSLLFWLILRGPIQTSRKGARSSGREKRSKKNFDSLGGFTAGGLKLIKVFCFFFSKKKFLLASAGITDGFL
jgi:hypothetical protein